MNMKQINRRIARLERKVQYLETSTAFRFMRVLALPASAIRAAARRMRPRPVSKSLPRSKPAETPETVPSDVAYLMAANAACDDPAWTQAMRNYLTQRSGSDIALLDGPDGRYFRIESPRYRVTTGPTVSVIMAAYNAETTIRRALLSVLNSTWVDLDVIVIDDASTDRTAEIVRSIADPRVRLIVNAVNVGPYASKNRALALVRGDFFTGHDADDFALPDGIERQMACMQSGSAASVGNMLRMTADGQIDVAVKKPGSMRQACISAMFRTDAFSAKLGAYDPVRYAADSEILERAGIVFGSGFCRDDSLRMICLRHPESLSNSTATGGLAKRRHRTFYRESYRDWHARMPDDYRLDPTHWPRKFPAPSDMLVGVERMS